MTRHEKIKQLTLVGVLAACILVLAFIPIRTVAFEITLTVIPIGVGAIIGGKKQGFLLGFIFGMVSFFQCFGYSPFGTFLFSMNPWVTFLVCVPTRILAGGLPALFHDAFSEKMNRHLCDAITWTCGTWRMRRNYLSNCQGITRCIKIRNNVGNIDFLVNVVFSMLFQLKNMTKKTNYGIIKKK